MMTVQQVADEAGLSPATVRYYHKQATRSRATGQATERDLPEPVSKVDGANVWDDDEIRDWIAARRSPAKRGAIPKDQMRAVLEHLEAGQIDRAITICRRNLV